MQLSPGSPKKLGTRISDTSFSFYTFPRSGETIGYLERDTLNLLERGENCSETEDNIVDRNTDSTCTLNNDFLKENNVNDRKRY